MGPSASKPEPACEHCGYALTGAPEPVCPECGTRFDPANPWRPAAAPPPWRTAIRSIGPMLLILTLLLAASAFKPSKNLLVWPLWSVWIPFIIAGAVVVPFQVARNTARASHPRVSRRAAARWEFWPAFMFNLIAVGLAIGIFREML